MTRFRNLVYDATRQTAYSAELRTVLPHPYQQGFAFSSDIRHPGQIHQHRFPVRDDLPAPFKLIHPGSDHPAFHKQLRRVIIGLGRDLQHVRAIISLGPLLWQMSFHPQRRSRFSKASQYRSFLPLNFTEPTRRSSKAADIPAAADTSASEDVIREPLNVKREDIERGSSI
jgi:hypothetical protein